MNKLPLVFFVGLLVLTGCSTTSPSITKERGVFTTLAMDGQNLDMPGGGYSSWKSFGPGQTPAAVVIGYGYWDGSFNQPQAFTLQVVESGTGTIILTRSGEAFAGKAAILDLPIRKSGAYSVKLLIGNSVYDTWDFTVRREVTSGEPTVSATAPAYAKGEFSASLDLSTQDDAFAQYNDLFLQDLMRAVSKEQEKSSRDIFAQVAPGKTSVECLQYSSGVVSSPTIVSTTLNETLSQFFVRALTNGSPYRAWSSGTLTPSGSKSRMLKIIFYLD